MILAGLFADLPTWAVGLSVSASLEEESMGTVTQDLQSVKWFDELGIEDVPSVEGKNASLGEMYRELAAKGVKVPNGFAVTADAYRAFLKEGKLDTAIRSILNDLDTHDLANLYLFNCRSLEHTMLHVGVRSGLGNSDSPISDSLAQPKPWPSRDTEEQVHEKDEKKSRGRIQGPSSGGGHQG